MIKLLIDYLYAFKLLAISLLLISNSLSAENIVTNDLGMSFVKIPAGEFKMGITEEERQAVIDEMEKPDFDAFVDEQPQHTVKISNSFLLGKTEVTQNQWFKVMENRPGPKDSWQQKNWQALPVVSISWFMAKRFTQELSKMDTKYNYRLPTEAEWEYAARAGNNQLRPVATKNLKDTAWYFQNSGDIPHPVASLKANAFGVHDMLGNVWEWVADWYAPNTYLKNSTTNPIGPEKGMSRVRRGGSYHCPLFQIRPNYRSANTPDTGYAVFGFRLVAIPKGGAN